MAQVRVGDRVRHRKDVGNSMYYGMTGTVVAPIPNGIVHQWRVKFDAYTSPHEPDGSVHTASFVLEPLTPPVVDAWASEQVKKWTKLEPQPEKLPTLREVMDYYRSFQGN